MSRVYWSMEAHPRSRGENGRDGLEVAGHEGSSPLTRGKRRPGVLPPSPAGLIPAHAGKTRIRRGTSRRGRAHPRSRGENTRFCNEILLHPGSSPLTRGKPPVQERSGDVGGLIPAHAGKTDQGRGGHDGEEAHPRSRGENCHAILPQVSRAGSSPLTRGKQIQFLESRAFDGLIPAHAGKTRP